MPMTKADRREFGGRLRDIRIERDLSMKQLAGRLGLSLTALGRYERGLMYPGLDVAVALSAALDVSVDYLATGRGSRAHGSPLLPRIERALQAIESLPQGLREALAALFLPDAKRCVPSGECR